MANDIVAVSKIGPVATVTLQRPPANAMSIELTEHIAEVFDDMANDPGVRAVIFTGQDKSFCAGLDLKIVPFFVSKSPHCVCQAARPGSRAWSISRSSFSARYLCSQAS